jgi:hypothetical protein
MSKEKKRGAGDLLFIIGVLAVVLYLWSGSK